jgi:hypothetical protein
MRLAGQYPASGVHASNWSAIFAHRNALRAFHQGNNDHVPHCA